MKQKVSDNFSGNLKLKTTKKTELVLKIKEMRLTISSDCPYSCLYCNLYFKKLYLAGKISYDELAASYKVGNESADILLDTNREEFSLEDYVFLFSYLKNNFGLEDVTLTGGDPFMNKNIQEIARTAKEAGLRTTAITKGAPLFACNNVAVINKKLKFIDRIIFSLDTMDKLNYAKNNLPLLNRATALGYLAKTLRVIRLVAQSKIAVEVNCVAKPLPVKPEARRQALGDYKKLIKFCLNNRIKKIKFIELDAPETLGKPFLNSFFDALASFGCLRDYLNRRVEVEQGTDKNSCSVSKVCSLKRLRRPALDIYAYRTHCPATFISLRSGDQQKGCEFRNGGELHLDFHGNSLLCQRQINAKKINLLKLVKSRNSEALTKEVLKINEMIGKQKCNF